MNVEVGTVAVPSVDPAMFALDGSGVGLVIGEAEPRDAEGSCEKGGKVGNPVVTPSDGFTEVGVTFVGETEPEVDTPGTSADVATGEAAVEDRDGDGGTATEVVMPIVGATGMVPSDDVGSGPGAVMSIITTVVTVVVLIEMDLWMISDP
ncbi:hypothetical protein CFE70_003358 [Pyrenophora teres f. teres 0-1]|uniref:Uncharacterized protein n=1 Tax=Pyrenophora teres f. teres (strain 0-1) TaxID=861557 RepID=E3S9Y9_PYRTT|nr:hypothetical protein PTT_19900 [Pyrenophora teres f. teres 0-1]KAE8846171.1 hypothetical protein HRS9139_00738 [Pyrenophora teres f. teres]CAA9959917.1 hypothetical protein PTMSG1_03325 [Pyrenophora teres f. maculata]KAE8848311.1 hypothetical protein PTNB85_02154 [Pyrenophora teres f. teres]KAE8868236.1 hypothetical protein PTNB29_02147 [Pyrenophora teres f. teres]